jgi:hypothetical protein
MKIIKYFSQNNLLIKLPPVLMAVLVIFRQLSFYIVDLKYKIQQQK